MTAEQGDGHGPTLAVVVVAFNRVDYLKGLIQSLISQEGATSFELVLLDNGSDRPLEREVSNLLERLPGPVTVVREPRNVLSPVRWQQAVEIASSDFILLPGDDDVACPQYLSEMKRLASAAPDVTLISGASGQIDSNGRRLPMTVLPAHFDSQAQALAALISANSYWMPASGFRKDAVDLAQAPQTRTAFDWWLWIQCWLAGSAATSDKEVVLYRQHGGQEQRRYGTQSFRLDAGRMLTSVVMGPQLEAVVTGWTDAEAETFAKGILDRSGPNSGDSRWGPLVQVLLADRLRGKAADATVAALHAQAAAQAGAPATSGVLRALTGDPTLDTLPPESWSRVPIAARWTGTCSAIHEWKRYLQLPIQPHGLVAVHFSCHCDEGSGAQHALRVHCARTDSGQRFALDLDAQPNEGSAAELLDTIGMLTGRLHGFEPNSGVEARVVDALRSLRRSRPGSYLEETYKRRTWSRRIHRGGQ